jgi:hypothetical protein
MRKINRIIPVKKEKYNIVIVIKMTKKSIAKNAYILMLNFGLVGNTFILQFTQNCNSSKF